MSATQTPPETPSPHQTPPKTPSPSKQRGRPPRRKYGHAPAYATNHPKRGHHVSTPSLQSPTKSNKIKINRLLHTNNQL
jgi:hypothetical protein